MNKLVSILDLLITWSRLLAFLTKPPTAGSNLNRQFEIKGYYGRI